MLNLPDNMNCTGCHACYNICATKCITMKVAKDGFLYPQADKEKCISCKLCEKVCPVLNEKKLNPKGTAYACINKNESIRAKSSSGGVFTLLAEYVIDNGGVVFGVAFDESSRVCHMEVNKKEDLEKLRGAKYIQSRIENTYNSAKKHLDSGKLVLFSGTPCQISGINSFLGREYDNLILQDIICHGVPSEMVWLKYFEEEKKKHRIKNAVKVNFRDKVTGWMGYSVTMENDTEKYSAPASANLYMRAFLQNLCLRNSCYNCKYKTIARESDITLADFWGIKNIVPEMNDNKGTSLVIVNSLKGENILKAISQNMLCKKVDIDMTLEYNPAAYKSAVKPLDREKFINCVAESGFQCAAKYIKKKSFITSVKKKVKKLFKK